jgi:hypothetical protein
MRRCGGALTSNSGQRESRSKPAAGSDPGGVGRALVYEAEAEAEAELAVRADFPTWPMGTGLAKRGSELSAWREVRGSTCLRGSPADLLPLRRLTSAVDLRGRGALE